MSNGNDLANCPPVEEDDDRPIGRILNRREILALLGGAAGAGLLAACSPAQLGTSSAASPLATATLSAEAAAAAESTAQSTVQPTVRATLAAEQVTAVAANTQIAATQVAVPACVVRPEATEGPYYVDVDLLRTDVREDRQGTPLQLTFQVTQVSDASCTPLAGALVEIWHCDAAGAYSGVSDPGFDTGGQTWLRGAQTTGAGGVATFTTIYPGWYSGRAVHIHFKIHPTETLVFTSQLFFPEEFTDVIHAQAPYAAKGRRDKLNSTDNIYQDLLLLAPTQANGSVAAGFPIGIDLATVGTGESGGGPGSRPPGPPPGGRQPGTPPAP